MPTFQTSKLRFIHVPKTGGWWVESVIQKLEPIDCYCIEPHGPHTWGDQSLFSFAFVRCPLTWYPSLYKYHVKHNWNHWKGKVPLHDSYEEWKSDYLSGNSYGTILDSQIGIPPAIDYVGEFENLESNTRTALIYAGYDPTNVYAAIRDTKPCNVS